MNALDDVERLIRLRVEAAQAIRETERFRKTMVGTEVAVESANREVAQSNVIFGRFGKGAAGQIGNVSNQLADLAIVAGSGNASVGALSVQVGQAASAFGPFGAAIGAAITIGGGLITFLLRSRAEAVSAEDALDNFATGLSALKDAATLSTTPFEELRQRFAGTREELEALVAAQIDLATLDANIAKIQLLTSTLGEYIDTTQRGTTRGYRADADNLLRGANEGVRSLIVDLRLARSDAEALQEVLVRAESAQGYGETADAIGEAVALLRVMTDLEGERSEAIVKTLRTLVSAEVSLREAAAASDILADSAAGVSDNFTVAANELDRMSAASEAVVRSLTAISNASAGTLSNIVALRAEYRALSAGAAEDDAKLAADIATKRESLAAALASEDAYIRKEAQADLSAYISLKREELDVKKAIVGLKPDNAAPAAAAGGGGGGGGVSLREVNRDVEDAQRVVESFLRSAETDAERAARQVLEVNQAIAILGEDIDPVALRRINEELATIGQSTSDLARVVQRPVEGQREQLGR